MIKTTKNFAASVLGNRDEKLEDVIPTPLLLKECNNTLANSKALIASNERTVVEESRTVPFEGSILDYRHLKRVL